MLQSPLFSLLSSGGSGLAGLLQVHPWGSAWDAPMDLFNLWVQPEVSQQRFPGWLSTAEMGAGIIPILFTNKLLEFEAAAPLS